MTTKMLHLAMWYAGHDPYTAALAASEHGTVGAGYDFLATHRAHMLAAQPAPVEQHR